MFMENIFFATLAAFCAGGLGAMGLGGGGVLLLWLALSGVEQLTAQGINLLFFLPVGAVGVWAHWKNRLVELSAALPMTIGGLLGLGAGILLAGNLPGRTLARLFGLLTAAIALREGWGAVLLFRKEGFSLLRKAPERGSA